MDARTRTIAKRYGAALLAVVVALACAVALDSLLPGKTPHLVFFAAVAIAAGYGGLVPGILATCLGAMASSYYFVRVHRWEGTPGFAVDLSVFVVVGLVVSSVSEMLHAAWLHAESDRSEADKAHRRLSFLAEAGTLLDQSLDVPTTMQQLARLAVPRLGDWCAVDLLNPDGSLGNSAVAHVQPNMEPIIHRLERRYPLDAHGKQPIQRALATGRADVYHDIPDSALVSAARNVDHLECLRALSIRSYLCVPLRSKSGSLGTMLFVSTMKRRFSDADVTLAEDLARRASLAIDNALLYQAAQQEIEERKRAEADLERQRQHIEELNERLRRAMTETHHRVKNNLQIIAGMVDMRLIEDGEYVSASEFRRLGAYVRTLAAVHDILTKGAKEDGQATHVSAKSILEKLLPLMQQTAGNRRIEYCLEDARLTARQGTSLALLVNELVSNAIKHGRSDVTVRLLRKNGAAILDVSDDGNGFPPGFDPQKAANTGLELVESLSRWDLGAETAFRNNPGGGGQVVVRIPIGDTIAPEAAKAIVAIAV